VNIDEGQSSFLEKGVWMRGVIPMGAHELSSPFSALSGAALAKFAAMMGNSNRNLHQNFLLGWSQQMCPAQCSMVW